MNAILRVAWIAATIRKYANTFVFSFTEFQDIAVCRHFFFFLLFHEADKSSIFL